MKSKFNRITALSIIGLFGFLNFANAAFVNCGGYDEDGTKMPECDIPTLILTINVIINFLLSWAWLISLVFIVWSGIQMTFSGGNEETLTKAKASLSNAVIGFIIIMIAFVLLNFVVGLLTGTGGLDANALKNAFRLIP